MKRSHPCPVCGRPLYFVNPGSACAVCLKWALRLIQRSNMKMAVAENVRAAIKAGGQATSFGTLAACYALDGKDFEACAVARMAASHAFAAEAALERLRQFAPTTLYLAVCAGVYGR